MGMYIHDVLEADPQIMAVASEPPGLCLRCL